MPYRTILQKTGVYGMENKALGVLSGKNFLGQDDFVIWNCRTEGKGVFDGKLHFHDFYELSFVYEGTGTYAVNGLRFPVEKGFLFLTTPSDYHILSVTPGTTLCYYNVIFRENLLAKEVTDLLYRLHAPLCLTVSGESFDRFRQDLQRMAADYTAEAVDPIPPLSALLVRNGIESLCVRALKSLPQDPNTASLPETPEEGTIRRALLYIRENYRSRLTLAKVAEAVELSPGYFSSLFKKTMHLGFSDYLLRYRLIIAAGYISSSDLPLKTIAAMNGFRSFPYFSASFSDYFGLSPREYRRVSTDG